MTSNEKSNIPMSDAEYFIIKRGDWEYSIDILISNHLDFNLFNLFMIFKSYSYEESIYLESLYIIISRNDEFSYTYKKIDLKKIQDSNFNEFVRILQDIIFNEKEYIKDYKYFGFRLIFMKYSMIIKSKKIYPIYPWNEEIKNFLLDGSIYRADYNLKIKLLEEKQKKLETRIKELEKELSEKK